MTNKSSILKNILDNDPDLKSHGFSSKDKINEQAFWYCIEWLREQKVAKTFSSNQTSYSLKHLVEAWLRSKPNKPYRYISNDDLIAAAVFLKIPVKINGTNTKVAIAEPKARKEFREKFDLTASSEL